MVNNEGDRYGRYHAFASKSARAAWVSEGGDFQTSPNFREVIKTSDLELRSLLRKADKLMAQGQSYEDSLCEANIALYAKGPAKHDQTGFVVEPSEFQA